MEGCEYLNEWWSDVQGAATAAIKTEAMPQNILSTK